MNQEIAARAAAFETNQEQTEQPQQQHTRGKTMQALLPFKPVVPTNKQTNIEKKTKDAERKQEKRNAAKNRREQLSKRRSDRISLNHLTPAGRTRNRRNVYNNANTSYSKRHKR